MLLPLLCLSACSNLGFIKLIFMKLCIRKFQDSNTLLWTTSPFKVNTLCSFKNLRSSHPVTQCHIPEDMNTHSHSNFV